MRLGVPITGVAEMLRRALNTLDHRLVDHGERVGYLVLRLLEEQGGQTAAELREGLYLALFHDIGAYKTEELSAMLNPEQLFSFEITNALSHSIYSSLFLRNFSALRDQGDAVLFHHFTYPKLLKTDCRNKVLAAKLFLADRIDIMLQNGLAANAEELLKRLDNPVFCPVAVAQLRRLEQTRGTVSKLMNGDYLDELNALFSAVPTNEEQTASLVRILPYAIDFRSEYTVTHTVATVEITLALAELLQLPDSEVEKLYYGSLLHDVGKISTSLLILEKQSQLTTLEFGFMQDHVLVTEMILRGGVSEEVLNIAVRHHEKLDGSGYPYGLTGDQLNQNERIVAVADILSALMGRRSYKEPFSEAQVCKSVAELAANGKICPDIVRLALENYSLLEHRVEQCSREAMERYRRMREDYYELLARYSHAI
ncbi:MAG: HD domain-containing protein [Angelakisella sp.]